MKQNKSTQNGCILNDSNYTTSWKMHIWTRIHSSPKMFFLLQKSCVLCSISSPLSFPPLPCPLPLPLPHSFPLASPSSLHLAPPSPFLFPLSLQPQATTDLTAFLVWPFPDFFHFIVTCLRQDTLQRKDVCDSWF